MGWLRTRYAAEGGWCQPERDVRHTDGFLYSPLFSLPASLDSTHNTSRSILLQRILKDISHGIRRDPGYVIVEVRPQDTEQLIQPPCRL